MIIIAAGIILTLIVVLGAMAIIAGYD